MPHLATSRTMITGAASGIGRALALRLHRAGHELVLVDSNGEALTAFVDQLGGADTKPSIITATADVTDTQAISQLFDQVAAHGAPLANVVHCAGILRTGPFVDQSPDDQLAVIMVNLGGTCAVAQAALPHLVRSRGMLVLMGSAAAFWGPPEYAVYGATKAAVNALAQSLRIELAGSGVAVGVCNPLFVATPMVTESSEPTPQLLAAQGIAHSAADVAAALQRGIARRQSQIWVGRRPRAIFVLSRLLFPLGHMLFLHAWRRSQGRDAAARAASEAPVT